MTRLLMLVGVAAVAAAMYVAASPASQQSKGPTEKQFLALKKTVTAQGKTIKQLTKFDSVVASFFADCVQGSAPINQFGDNTVAQTEGYDYSQPAGAGNFLTTAIDFSDPSDTGAAWITGGDSTCGTLVNGSGLRHAAAKAGVRLQRASHPFSFVPHQK